MPKTKLLVVTRCSACPFFEDSLIKTGHCLTPRPSDSPLKTFGDDWTITVTSGN